MSDIHGQHHLLREAADAAKPPFDVIAVCGDWTTFGRSADLAPGLDLLLATGAPVVGVSGNCDSAEIESYLQSRGVSLDGMGRMVAQTGFFGISASNRTGMDTPFERSEPEILCLLESGYQEIREARRKILISHVPPFNTTADQLRGGVHAGSRSLRNFLERYPVDLVLCGHIHEAAGIDQIGKTQVVNVGPLAHGRYAIIRIDESIQTDLLSLE